MTRASPLLAIVLSFSKDVGAQEVDAGFSTPGLPEFGQMLGSLALILVVIYCVSLLLRHLRFGGDGNSDGLSIVTSLSLSPKERLLVVRVGQEQVLVGSSPAGLQTLHRLKAPISVDDTNTPEKKSFGDLFRGLNRNSPSAS